MGGPGPGASCGEGRDGPLEPGLPWNRVSCWGRAPPRTGFLVQIVLLPEPGFLLGLCPSRDGFLSYRCPCTHFRFSFARTAFVGVSHGAETPPAQAVFTKVQVVALTRIHGRPWVSPATRSGAPSHRQRPVSHMKGRNPCNGTLRDTLRALPWAVIMEAAFWRGPYPGSRRSFVSPGSACCESGSWPSELSSPYIWRWWFLSRLRRANGFRHHADVSSNYDDCQAIPPEGQQMVRLESSMEPKAHLRFLSSAVSGGLPNRLTRIRPESHFLAARVVSCLWRRGELRGGGGLRTSDEGLSGLRPHGWPHIRRQVGTSQPPSACQIGRASCRERV